jgi:hypothetical protein
VPRSELISLRLPAPLTCGGAAAVLTATQRGFKGMLFLTAESPFFSLIYEALKLSLLTANESVGRNSKSGPNP